MDLMDARRRGPDVDLDEVRTAFALPRPLEVVSHHPGADGVWRVRSAGRDFALKVLRQHGAWGKQQTADQTTLELAAARAGLPIPSHVPPAADEAGILAVLSSGLDADAAAAPVRRLASLHEWVETLPNAGQLQAADLHRWLGTTLACLHGLLPLSSEAAGGPVLDGAYDIAPVSEWVSWVEEAHQQGQPWADTAEALLEVVPTARARVQEGLSDPSLPRCLTHRDVNPSNVLHTPDGPMLCDFGYAGPDIGWFEAVSTAVSFEAPDVLPAYLAAGGTRGPADATAFCRALGSSLNWAAFSMWLSLGHRDVRPETRQEATDRVARICRDVITRVTHPQADRAIALPSCPRETQLREPG